MPQINLPEWVEKLEKANLLKRIKEETRVDELPMLMEQNPDNAILVENVKDAKFPFLSGAYGTRSMFAMQLGCKEGEIGEVVSKRLESLKKPTIVSGAAFQEVVTRGDDVDLTMFPLFCHHPRDGQAFLNDTNIVTCDPETGVHDVGIYRLMFGERNVTSINMQNVTRTTRVNAEKFREQGKELPVACILGGPPLNKLAQFETIPGVDDYDVLGGVYGESVELVKCITNDLLVPANSEIVLEGRMMVTEGYVHDEGAYGEYTGTYGGGLPHDHRIVWDCITHRKGAMYQYASIGGYHPGRTDMIVAQPTVEIDCYTAMKRAGLDVVDVYCPPPGCANVAYARIRPHGGGDANNALTHMLTCSRHSVPKVAYVFDGDVDIYDPDRVQWAFAFRYNPERGTTILPRQNANALDPSLTTFTPPFHVSKIGFDCTIPLEKDVHRWAYALAEMVPPLDQSQPKEMSEEDLAEDMQRFIKERPRAWIEIVKKYAGQPYPILYRAFGRLRPRLGRLVDEAPYFPYVLSDKEMIYGKTAEEFMKENGSR